MPERNGKGRGFTLIELLVVIAIIALLAAILFPVFARARENARRASCMSNLKQIALGMVQYTQDYDEQFPMGNWVYPGTALDTTTTVPWEIVIQPYLKSSQIFNCPSSTIAKYDLTSPALAASIGYNFWTAFNNGISRPDIRSFKTPSETLMLADGEQYMIRAVSHTSPQTFRIGDGTIRHLDGGNICFYDGHVKWLPKSKIPLLLDTEANIGDLPNAASYTFWVGQ